MSRRYPWFVAIAALAVGCASALADVPPPPGSRERAAAEKIRKAGYTCPRVVKRQAASTGTPGFEQLTWGGSYPSLITCSNGKRFLVAEQPGWKQLRGKQPPPPPEPIVRPL